MLTQLARNDVWEFADSGAPTNGVTGVNLCGPGSSYIDVATGNTYTNKGTKANPNWHLNTTA